MDRSTVCIGMTHPMRQRSLGGRVVDCTCETMGLGLESWLCCEIFFLLLSGLLQNIGLLTRRTTDMVNGCESYSTSVRLGSAGSTLAINL